MGFGRNSDDVGRQLVQRIGGGEPSLWSRMEWQLSRQPVRNSGVTASFYAEPTSVQDIMRSHGGVGVKTQMREFHNYPHEATHQNVDPNVEMAKHRVFGGNIDCELQLNERNATTRSNPEYGSRVLEEVGDLGNVSGVCFQLQGFHHPAFGFLPSSVKERVASNDGTSDAMDCLMGDFQAAVAPDAMSPCFKSDNYSPPNHNGFDLLAHVSPPPENATGFAWQPQFVMCEDLEQNVSSSLGSATSFLLPPAALGRVSAAVHPDHLDASGHLSREAIPGQLGRFQHLHSSVPLTREAMPGPPFAEQMNSSGRPRSPPTESVYTFSGSEWLDDDLAAARSCQDARTEMFAAMEITQAGKQSTGPKGDRNHNQLQTLKNLVMRFSEAIESGNDAAVHASLTKLEELSSPDGDVPSRVALCFAEAFSQRLGKRRGPIGPESGEAVFLDVLEDPALTEACPYAKFVHLTANQALLEAVQGAEILHIIDFGILRGVQWSVLLQALTTEAGRHKPPRIRITGIASPKLGQNPLPSLQATGRRLTEFAELLGLELEFCPLTEELGNLEPEMFQVSEGERVAINFTLRLHQNAGEQALLNKLLKLVRDLQPEVVVLVEYEAAVSKVDVQTRLLDALEHYCAFFESLDATMASDCIERANIERFILAEEIKALFGCERTDGKVRHETFERWSNLMESSGFRAAPPSHYSTSQARMLLWLYNEKFKLIPSPRSLSLDWQDRRLITISAWNCC